jgi:hypothetical protein
MISIDVYFTQLVIDVRIGVTDEGANRFIKVSVFLVG